MATISFFHVGKVVLAVALAIAAAGMAWVQSRWNSHSRDDDRHHRLR